MNRLRTRLIAVFLVATLLPLGLTLWTSLSLLERSLQLAPVSELDTLSQSLERTGRELYQQARESLRRDVAEGRIQGADLSPADARAFRERGLEEEFVLAGANGDRLDYYVSGKHDNVVMYSRQLRVPLGELTRQIGAARQTVETSGVRDFRRGFSRTLLLVAASLWLAALAALVFMAARISRPVRQLTQGLERVAAGDLATRVEEQGSGEIAAAMQAFNHMASQLQQAQERLIQVTRVASWQALARKMAHEVKNSLTPIRLTMEEIVSRKGAADGAFLEQAAQIVADEVNTLEKRVRAFSEFSAEPPVLPAEIDVNALVEERVSFLKNAHPEVIYQMNLAPDRPKAVADPDLIKGVLTNLLENAAEAARPGGVVMARTARSGEQLNIEVHDSGPGLSLQAQSSLFEPTISFKKGGMGLGLSIARRSALLCGGDIQTLDGELGGAAFRVILAAVRNGV
ncbi:MAG: HAMP domain-containing histidine kinase [Acidobacteriia bacterium]|nr:HAMP domain-containing histidine kinase [Terriglobia bacterium]